MSDGEIDGWCDAAMGLPSQAPVRFLEIFHKFEPDQWPDYQAAYHAAYERRRKEQH